MTTGTAQTTVGGTGTTPRIVIVDLGIAMPPTRTTVKLVDVQVQVGVGVEVGRGNLNDGETGVRVGIGGTRRRRRNDTGKSTRTNSPPVDLSRSVRPGFILQSTHL